MALKIYGVPLSPPFRAVMLTARAIGLKPEVIPINVFKTTDNRKPEYLKKNPQHTIPVLEEKDGFTLGDSHAICAYLVGKYSPNDDSLYPIDLRKRAIVDQRMHFDTEKLFIPIRAIMLPILTKKSDKIHPANVEMAHEGYQFLDKFASNSNWIAGDNMTIADLCIAASMGNLMHMVPFDPEKYSNVSKWYQKVEKLPYFDEVSKEAVEKGRIFFKKFL